jgi:cation:H+ antiporter
MHLLDTGRIVLGLVLLVAGGELLVRGASGLATRIGMSSLVVGLTVVAFATSAPELAVTLGAVMGGEPGLAVGNVVGSNIANVLMILGSSAIILPLLVKVQLVRIDIPFMAALSRYLLSSVFSFCSTSAFSNVMVRTAFRLSISSLTTFGIIAIDL